MKQLNFLIVTALLLTAATGLADSRTYCDDIHRIDSLPRLNSAQFKNFVLDGEKIDRLVVSKDRRWMYALDKDVIIKAYRFALGASPLGHKQFAGDQKTPEGVYTIDDKNPQSQYHKALHVSYPNKKDTAYARLHGRSPGGNIMIHGFPVEPSAHRSVQQTHPTFNWTAGCIAVRDSEIDELYAFIDRGLTIEICKASTARK